MSNNDIIKRLKKYAQTAIDNEGEDATLNVKADLMIELLDRIQAAEDILLDLDIDSISDEDYGDIH